MSAFESEANAFVETDRNPATSLAWSSLDSGIVLLLLTVFAIFVFIIEPNGDFPLNDDWAYILPVEWLVKLGRLRFTDWQFMTLIGQVYLGAAAAIAFGFSITNLRLMVLLLAAMSVALIYVTARLAQAPRPWALVLAGLLLCNPIFLITSASFMTDTPFLAAALLSIVFFLLWQTKLHGFYGFACWFFVFFACSIRQSAIALAVGFCVFSVFRFGITLKTLLTTILPTCVAAACIAAYPIVIGDTVGLPSIYNQPTLEAKAFILGIINLKLGYLWMAAKTLLVVLYYVGMSAIPLLPITLNNLRRHSAGSKFTDIFITAIISGVLAIILVYSGHAVPLHGNTLFDFGLGIRTLQSDQPNITAPPELWWVVAFLSMLGLLSLRGIVSDTLWRLRLPLRAKPSASFSKPYIVMLATIIVIYNLPFLTRGGIWFDRYAIPNLALFGLLAAPCMPSLPLAQTSRFAISMVLIAGSLAFSVTATHDYLEWNRQRWAGAAELAATYGVDFDQIDAGFEYNNYKPRQSGDFHRPPEQVLLTNPGAKYRIAFSNLPQHQVLKVLECRTWLYGSPSSVFLLRSES